MSKVSEEFAKEVESMTNVQINEVLKGLDKCENIEEYTTACIKKAILSGAELYCKYADKKKES